MSRLLVACICFFALAATGYSEDATKRGNDYIDKMIKDMFETNKDKYDPYEMNDTLIGISKNIAFINIKGEAKLHGGTIKGLSTMRRNRDSSLNEEGEKLRVKADLAADRLEFRYSGSVKFMEFGPTINVEGRASSAEAHIEFTCDSQTGENGELVNFKLDDLRDTQAWVTGLGPVGWALTPIVSVATKIFKETTKQVVEVVLKRHIAEHIPEHKFPVEKGGEAKLPIELPKPERIQSPEP